MDLYFKLLKYPVFSVADLSKFYNNQESARTALKRLIARGMVKKIRRNLYTCINGETEAPVANRFQIASSISPSSYVTHHSAMEYYGITDQVFYYVYVASETAFNSFTFDGYTYQHVKSDFMDGVETAEYSGGVRVTDKERTLIDSIKDMDKIAGTEEVLDNIQSYRRVDAKRLIRYLDLYNNQFLYQKTGYILSHILDKNVIDDEFFEYCKSKIGKSSRYLTSDSKKGMFDNEWKLVVPENILNLKNGGILDADI